MAYLTVDEDTDTDGNDTITVSGLEIAKNGTFVNEE